MHKVSSFGAIYKTGLAFLVALLFTLLINGAVPGLLLPTLGQAVWATGFGQSFSNESFLSIHATNFGLPRPAPIAFGLAGAYPTSLLIGAGLHPADAYAAMVALWLAVALFGAWRMSALLGVHGVRAAITATLWVSMPITWAHTGYSMLSLGFALLPLYLWTALRLFTKSPVRVRDASWSAALFVSASVIAVFMDGYTYVMFAVGTGLLGAFCFIRFPVLRRKLLLFALPVTIGGFGVASCLYMLYMGRPLFTAEPLEFFRGWGLDITFLSIPTQGMHWFWDAAGLSIPRTSHQFFGDDSVWRTTFALPVIVAGIVAWWRTRRGSRFATGFLILGLVGLYLALGPSLKVDSVRPMEVLEAGDHSPLMPAEFAVGPTGSAFLWEHVPGFRNMRAVYRWLGLGLVAFWGLIVLSVGRVKSRIASRCGLGLLVVLIVLNVPHIGNTWHEARGHREAFISIDDTLLSEMRLDVHEDELVAFLPYRNDFLVNYIAARLRIRTFNIGGDKNLFAARQHWPPTMKEFLMEQVDSGFADRILLLLARQEAHVVVIPYIDMLRAAHEWPAPAEHRDELAPVVVDLKASGFVTVQDREYYAVVRIAPDYRTALQDGTLAKRVLEERCITPVCLAVEGWQLDWMPRLVGDRVDDGVESDGRQGVLLYGPYVAMNAGEYSLVVRGAASSTETAWVDVVSDLGAVEHARFPLSPTPEGEPGVLAEGRVALSEAVDDLEVRVHVGEEDNVRLEGYELTPVSESRTDSPNG